MSDKFNRRKFLKTSIATSAAASLSLEEKILLAKQNDPNQLTPKAPVNELPKAKIGDVTLSRLIAGGNLIGGWAHGRDLLYVSNLLKEYNTEEKIFETLQLCEQNGIDSILINPSCLNVVNKYRNERGGKIKIICECHPKLSEDVHQTVNTAIDGGASLIYIQGGFGDRLVKSERIDIIGATIDAIKENNLPAGIGGHCLRVPMDCEKFGIDPDFYVKTLHNDNYWSATPEETRTEDWGRQLDHNKNCDNIWCVNPEETIEFMQTVKKPWIAFKVLAAGAIHPNQGFKFAFQNGADLICVGMFDFQVAKDAQIAKNTIKTVLKNGRKRPWFA
jgi:hypothetical protein